MLSLTFEQQENNKKFYTKQVGRSLNENRICYFVVLQEGATTQSVERAPPGEEVLGSIPAVATSSPLVGSVAVICYPVETDVMVSPLHLVCGGT